MPPGPLPFSALLSSQIFSTSMVFRFGSTICLAISFASWLCSGPADSQ